MLRIAGLNLIAIIFLFGPLARLSLQTLSVALEHLDKNYGGPSHRIIRVKLTARLLKIHLSLLVKANRSWYWY